MFIVSMLIAMVSFVAFPESTDAIFAGEKPNSIFVESSGSLGYYKKGKCVQTYGNDTLKSDEYTDWCSNIAYDKKDPNQNPWIQYSLDRKQMKITKYSVRNGCCHYPCCCTEENGRVVDYGCCCFLYSYSLRASNDNKTWTVLHKVEKDRTFDYCGTKTFELAEMSSPYRYFRFVLDEEWPNCPKCMQINQIELYGKTISAGFTDYDGEGEEEESISIIGRVKKSE